jgi:hypothetical protein
MLEGKELHDGRFLKILWDDPSHIVGINWKETTAEMSDDDAGTLLRLESRVRLSRATRVSCFHRSHSSIA